MLDYGALSPEINSGRMYAGPGSATMLAAAGGWDGLAADLHSTASGYQSVVSSLTDESWMGPVAMAMVAAVTPYVVWLRATATQCEQAASQATAAAAAYESAFAMTVPPPVVVANRVQMAALVATNILGQNTALIAATEAHYGVMWAQDAAAMYTYAANSAVASALRVFAPPPQTTNPAGSGNQAVGVAQTAGTSAGTHAQTATTQLISTVPQTLQGLATPGSSTTAGLSQTAMSGVASLGPSGASGSLSSLSSLTGASGKSASKSASAGVGAVSSLAAASNGGALGLFEDTLGLGMDTVGLAALDGGGLGLDVLGVGVDLTGADSLFATEGVEGLGSLGPLSGLAGLLPFDGLAPLGGLGAGASASLGQAASLGTLSVPASWGEALSVGPMTPVGAVALPGTTLGAAPAVAANGPTISKLPMAGMVGREADGAVQRIGFRSSVIPHSPMAG